MIAGDKGQVVELGVDAEAVAIGRVLGRKDEQAVRQPLATANLDPYAGDDAHGPGHGADIAAHHAADPASARRQRGEGGPQRVEDSENPEGGVEGETAHGRLL